MPDGPQATSPGVGDRVDHYLLTGLITRGGMGSVFVARDERLGRDVAIKLLPPHLTFDRVFRTRFEREYQIAGSIRHPNIIPIYDAGDWRDQLYIAMLLVEGPNLGELLKRQSPLPVPRVISIVDQVASALEAAHGRGLVHRDVKPANILLLEGRGAGGADHVYLVDFGLVRADESVSELTKSGAFLGTLLYVAPEQLAGTEIDGRADEYSLAATTYEMLASRPPFQRDNEFGLINAHMNEPAPRLVDIRPDLPRTMSDVIERAMAKSPDGRFTTITAFASALAAGAAERERAAAAPTVAPGMGGVAATAVAASDVASTVTASPPPPTMPPTSPPNLPPPEPAGAAAREPSRVAGAMVALMVLIGLGVLIAIGIGLGSFLGGSSPNPAATTVAQASIEPGATTTAVPLASIAVIPTADGTAPASHLPSSIRPSPGRTPRSTPRQPPPTVAPTDAPPPTVSPTTPVTGLPQVRAGTWAVTDVLRNVVGEPHYTLGDHDRRYVVNPQCALAALCRLVVASYDAQTGRKLGNIVYRWNGDAFTYSGDAGYFRQAGGADCQPASGDLIANAYRTREQVRMTPQNLADITRLTGTKVITGTPTAAAAGAGCAPFELHYDATMTFTNP